MIIQWCCEIIYNNLTLLRKKIVKVLAVSNYILDCLYFSVCVQLYSLRFETPIKVKIGQVSVPGHRSGQTTAPRNKRPLWSPCPTNTSCTEIKQLIVSLPEVEVGLNLFYSNWL